MLKIILIAFTLVSSYAQDNSEEVPKTPFEYTKKIYNELEEIKKIKPENYFSSIDHINGLFCQPYWELGICIS